MLRNPTSSCRLTNKSLVLSGSVNLLCSGEVSSGRSRCDPELRRSAGGQHVTVSHHLYAAHVSVLPEHRTRHLPAAALRTEPWPVRPEQPPTTRLLTRVAHRKLKHDIQVTWPPGCGRSLGRQPIGDCLPFYMWPYMCKYSVFSYVTIDEFRYALMSWNKVISYWGAGLSLTLESQQHLCVLLTFSQLNE